MVLEQSSEMHLAHSSEDLENYTSRRRLGTRRGLLAAGGVAVVLMVLVISVTVYVNQVDDGSVNAAKQSLVAKSPLKRADGLSITLTDVLSGAFSARGYNGSWISGDEIQFFDPVGSVIVYNVQNQTRSTIIEATEFDKISTRPSEVTLSPNRKLALIGYDSQKVYRHSFTAKYAIYDLETKTFEILSPANAPQQLLQFVQWSPSNAVAFVHENNVYYKAGPGAPVQQLTSDGGPQIYNGIADWVYEEEMFGTYKALWFSNNGSNLAFARFDDFKVKDIQFSLYGNAGQYPYYQYPLIESIPYPKAGTDNPTATIHIATNLNQAGPIQIVNAVQLTNDALTSYYIGTVLWASDSDLVVLTLNRSQNHLESVRCSDNGGKGWACKTMWTVDEPRGWIDIMTPLVSEDGNKFLVIKPVMQKTYSYRHIVMYDRNSPTPVAVTSGDFSVDAITAWDQANKRVFFTSTGYNKTTSEAIPSESHLYVADISGSVATTTCITCDTRNTETNSACRANSVEISKNFKSFVHTCSGPSVPEVLIRSIEDVSDVREVWVNNTELKQKVKTVSLPVPQDYIVPVANGFTARARLWLPPNYEKGKKYPMLVDVYAGPGSQKITERFGVDWGTSLVSSKNIIYASIDGRGSGRQSEDLMFQLYRKLGTVEIEDQIAVAKWLIENNVDDVIDANRTAIWGWSYGGYSTAMVMGTDVQGIYKCGISVAPVTSWVFYDTIYTERYMGLPTKEDNLVSYNSSDVTNYVQNFRTKKYYLIHGNADDNVHYQQSMLLSRALEKADILFRQQSYPDENHALGSVRRHLYHSLENFLEEECF